MAENKPAAQKPTNDAISQVADRVKSSDNVLVALSKNPSVDELAGAIGLTLALDKIGKHATAIFSGEVPNTLEFLQPENTFETNTNSLQDFIIALNKEKADHLRYKIEGDFVKVFITPYRTTIDESDLEFSHGDFNIDFVISLNVASSDDLDGALAEHGRIMHDATSVNITTDVPGKFADLEWSNPAASSVSEMVVDLSEKLGDKNNNLLDKQVATALLTGIVSATNRFSNAKTTPSTMVVASKLMSLGADQQLISSNIPVDIDMAVAQQVAAQQQSADAAQAVTPAQDPSSLSVNHGEQQPTEDQPAQPVEEGPQMADVHGAIEFEPQPRAGALTPEQELEQIVQTPSDTSSPLMNELKLAAENEEETYPRKDYGALIEQELKSDGGATPAVQTQAPSDNLAAQAAPAVATAPEINGVPAINYAQVPETVPEVSAPLAADNRAYLNTAPETVVSPEPVQAVEQQPVATTTPPVAAEPVVVAPEPLPMPDGSMLPPPPPPFDPSSAIPLPTAPVATAAVQPSDAATAAVPQVPAEPVMPEVQPIAPAVLAPEPQHTYLGANPAMPDQVYPPAVNDPGDPGAFQIPM